MQEVFLAARYPLTAIPLATEIRSTLVVSALQTVRARGLMDKYRETLPASAQERITSLVAGSWIPVELALDHYRAMDRLQLTNEEIDGIGADVAARVNKSVLSIAVSLSKRAGATPWTALSVSHRINDTNWRGSDIAIYRLGPKEARYDWLGQPCASVPYFVTAFGGFLRGLGSLFSSRIYVRLAPSHCSPRSVSYRLSWV